MKTAAVLCEFNPFHNGHAFLFSELRKRYGIDRIVCIMSGNYVQRGEPAVFDKYVRAEAAVKNGADLVVEMPQIFAVSSARDFASCGVRIASALSVCDCLCFGVESEKEVLEYLNREEPEDEHIREALRNGATYPEALTTGSERLAPNNILAAEYIRAIEETGSSLVPVMIERNCADHNAEEAVMGPAPEGNAAASALSIRNLIWSGNPEKASLFLPETAKCQFSSPAAVPDMLSSLLSERLLTEENFENYLDVSPEIAGRLENRKNVFLTFDERTDDTKTRQYTRSRIRRALLHIVLRMTREEAFRLKEDGWFRYLRVLAYREDSGILKRVKENTDLEIVTRAAIVNEIDPVSFLRDQIYDALTYSKSEFFRQIYIRK